MIAVEQHRVALAGGALAVVLHVPESSTPAPCVVACHGLGASKDSDKYLLLAAALPAAGLALARFDFRGCGESSGVEEAMTIATRVEDTEAVLDFLGRHPRLDGRFGLLGSSLGGFVALHVAARRPGLPVVTWNAPASLTELANDDLEDGRGLGVPFAVEYASGRYALAPRGVPMHLVALHEGAGEPCDLVIIDGGDHRLTDPAHRRRAVELSREWLVRYVTAARSPAGSA